MLQVGSNTKELEDERNYWLNDLSNRDDYELVEHTNEFYYYKSIWNKLEYMNHVPIETRIKIYESRITVETGIFCPECDRMMKTIEEGTEWTGGIFTWKSKYRIEKCPHCGYKIRW